MKNVIAVMTYDLRGWMASGVMWRLGGVYAAFMAATIFIGWPSAQKLSRLAPVGMFGWYTKTHYVAAAYIALNLGADIWPKYDKADVFPSAWIIHRLGSVGQVIAGKTAAVGAVLILFIFTTAPMTILAAATEGVPVRVFPPFVLIGCDVLMWSLLGMAARAFGGPTPLRPFTDLFFVVAASGIVFWTVSRSDLSWGWINPMGALDHVIFSSFSGRWPLLLSVGISRGLGLLLAFALAYGSLNHAVKQAGERKESL